MTRPTTTDTDAQEALIRQAGDRLYADARILACWLEGSFASGTADPWSDIDLHVAIADTAWERFVAERLEFVGRIRPLFGFVETKLPWGAHLVSANVSGPVRLDLFIEKRSGLAAAPRREQPVVLFERGGVAATLRTHWDSEALVRLQLAQLLQLFFFGCAWPVRLSGREEWGTLLMNAMSCVYQFLVPAILIQDDADNFFRPQYHNERHLSPDRRRQVNALVEQIRASFAGIATGQLDEALVTRAHERLVDAILRELRRACEMHGATYLTEAEREMREYYHREMGWQIND